MKAYVLWGLASIVAFVACDEGAEEVEDDADRASDALSLNLALGKPAFASSVDSTGRDPAMAFDGTSTTRWASDYSDDQWIYVDLGAVSPINEVKLTWETAYAKAYEVQLSNDAVTWSTIYSTTTGDGGVDDLTGFSASGRYVRMKGSSRSTEWGYSLWEFEVYGAPPNVALGKPAQASSVERSGRDAARAFDGSTSTRWSSAYKDSEWLSVDLGATYDVNSVKLTWQSAYAKGYEIQVSDDARAWRTIATTTAGDGGVDELKSLQGSGRYVRMLGTRRGTSRGYSLWEFAVYGAPSGTTTTTSPDGGAPPVADAGSTPPGSGSVSGEPMPVGDMAGWKQLFADDFTTPVPVGAFSDCNHNADTPEAYCGGLAPYGNYQKRWWAYPNNWSDTAKSGADGNAGAPFGGVYHPEDTVFIGDGAMHIKMFRPTTGGDNHVASVVPIPCMDHQYGRYVERIKVVRADPGFKSAHLFYQGGFEIDYPENDYGETISAYTHPGEASFSTNSRWTEWHTTVIEWTAGSVKFSLDGKVIGTTTVKVPNIPMSWVLQNESSILGPYASPGAVAQLDLDWVACYAPN
jgi:hypothetical protein